MVISIELNVEFHVHIFVGCGVLVGVYNFDCCVQNN